MRGDRPILQKARKRKCKSGPWLQGKNNPTEPENLFSVPPTTSNESSVEDGPPDEALQKAAGNYFGRESALLCDYFGQRMIHVVFACRYYVKRSCTKTKYLFIYLENGLRRDRPVLKKARQRKSRLDRWLQGKHSPPEPEDLVAVPSTASNEVSVEHEPPDEPLQKAAGTCFNK